MFSILSNPDVSTTHPYIGKQILLCMYNIYCTCIVYLCTTHTYIGKQILLACTVYCTCNSICLPMYVCVVETSGLLRIENISKSTYIIHISLWMLNVMHARSIAI